MDERNPGGTAGHNAAPAGSRSPHDGQDAKPGAGVQRGTPKTSTRDPGMTSDATGSDQR